MLKEWIKETRYTVPVTGALLVARYDERRTYIAFGTGNPSGNSCVISTRQDIDSLNGINLAVPKFPFEIDATNKRALVTHDFYALSTTAGSMILTVIEHFSEDTGGLGMSISAPRGLHYPGDFFANVPKAIVSDPREVERVIRAANVLRESLRRK